MGATHNLKSSQASLNRANKRQMEYLQQQSKEHMAEYKKIKEEANLLFDEARNVYYEYYGRDGQDGLIQQAQKKHQENVAQSSKAWIDKFDAAVSENYGANASDFLRKQAVAGLETGAQMGLGAGAQLLQSASTLARQSGANRGLLLLLGLGQLSQLLQSAYLQGNMYGRESYKDAATLGIDLAYSQGALGNSQAVQNANIELGNLGSNFLNQYGAGLDAYNQKYQQAMGEANISNSLLGGATQTAANLQLGINSTPTVWTEIGNVLNTAKAAGQIYSLFA